jgi:hypothetical protein
METRCRYELLLPPFPTVLTPQNLSPYRVIYIDLVTLALVVHRSGPAGCSIERQL